jgi:carbonic anhydrase/acetyltransferase-like protein (isoleucine patch superfamily)
MGHIGKLVQRDPTAFIHETAFLYGKISLGAQASVWPFVVMRAEAHDIMIGARSNIQDFVMVHVGSLTSTVVGVDCSIAHHATLHGCTIGDRCLIGINATLMDGVRLGSNSVVAGHSILTEGSQFPDNSIVGGVPARLLGTRDQSAGNTFNAALYVLNAANYARGIERLSDNDLAVLGHLKGRMNTMPNRAEGTA